MRRLSMDGARKKDSEESERTATSGIERRCDFQHFKNPAPAELKSILMILVQLFAGCRCQVVAFVPVAVGISLLECSLGYVSC